MKKRPQPKMERPQPKMVQPDVVIPVIRIPQADGSVLLRPGKPVVAEPMIGASQAAGLLGASLRWVEAECESGAFKTARRLGRASRSWWKIARAEVLERRESSKAKS